jgi:TRAP-type C4-dicarboxylate transport system permease small subunit
MPVTPQPPGAPRTALRRGLDALYLLGGVLGAVALTAIAVIIAAQVIGRQFGATVLGADDLTAFSVAASATLPLAYAFRHGAHIRVDLIIGRLTGRPRFVMETIALVLTTALTAFFAYAMLDLAWDSFEFDDVAQGSVAWKLWIPQAMVGSGVALLAICLLDDLIVHLTGGTPSYRRAAEGSALDRAAEEL